MEYKGREPQVKTTKPQKRAIQPPKVEYVEVPLQDVLKIIAFMEQMGSWRREGESLDDIYSRWHGVC